jgi:hypothetical protein
MLAAGAVPGVAGAEPPAVAANVRIDPQPADGGGIPAHFVGVSIEWSLIDRYMGPGSRAGFARLLGNLGSGLLRIGGSSQDQIPFDATAQDTERVITPNDLASIRSTLDMVDSAATPTPAWVTVLGTSMAPATPQFPWRGVAQATAFVRDGVAAKFGDAAGRRELAGISLGNEPDLTYAGDLSRYLSDFTRYAGADELRPWPRVLPATSENIGSWQSIRDRTIDTRWFWDWPTILASVAPAVEDQPGALAPFATDHFYPLARTCVSDPYRCPSIARLLSQERMDNFDYQVYRHAADAAGQGLGFRMDETNTAAGRGAPGVSDVAASATWTLDTLFNAACPQPPDQPGANADCHLGATGVNVHNAEVRAYFFPQEGNAYYNAIRYDPASAAGTPTPAPSYYALLLFALLAQGTSGLRPVAVDTTGGPSLPVSAWEVRAGEQRRLFVINKGVTAVAVQVQTPGSSVELDRMTPYDPAGAGRTLDASDVRIDGRAVTPDGSFPGLAPTRADTLDGQLAVTLVPGEAVAVTPHFAETEQAAGVGAGVPATLALTLGAPASLGTLTPGVDRSYDAATTASLTSTAGDATLSVMDAGATPGRLANGSLALAQPLQIAVGAQPFVPLPTTPSTPLALLAYAAPVSHDAITIAFRQHIASREPLRTGAYSTTLTFTLSTTTP